MTRPVANNAHEQQYLDVLQELLDKSTDVDNRIMDRTGVGTVKLIGKQLRFDVSDGSIPMLTTKLVPFKTILREVLWYFQGTGNIGFLKEHNIKIWDQWADDNGDLGPVYGVQWRNFNLEGVDQVADVIELLKTDPMSRRMIVTAWNPTVLPDTTIAPRDNVSDGDHGNQALPPCHYTFQLVADKVPGSERLKLSLILSQRSCDFFLGGAFNIVSYTIILRMFCQVANMDPGELIWNIGDCHLYSNHIEAAKEQLKRTPLAEVPKLFINSDVDDIDDFTEEDFSIGPYYNQGVIRAPVAV